MESFLISSKQLPVSLRNCHRLCGDLSRLTTIKQLYATATTGAAFSAISSRASPALTDENYMQMYLNSSISLPDLCTALSSDPARLMRVRTLISIRVRDMRVFGCDVDSGFSNNPKRGRGGEEDGKDRVRRRTY